MEDNNEASIMVLSEDCLAITISLTSPLDACRSAAVSKDFKSIADSDAVWDRFLPPDYDHITANAVSPVVFDSKKKLYHLLSDSHILLDRGYLSFMLDKLSGKKCYMLGSRELSIVWGNDPRYWIWQHLPESRFPEVAILRDVCWLDIQGKIATSMLSRKSTYKAYLVFRIAENSWGLDEPGRTMVSFCGTGYLETFNVCLRNPRQEDDRFPSERNDGWMEIELGEFYCDDEDDGGEVEMTFKEVWSLHWKSGLIVEGIELR